VKPDKFMSCLKVFLDEPYGSFTSNNILFSEDGNRIIGFKQSVGVVKINSTAIDGVQMLKETRKVFEQGPAKTFGLG
jgi:hypothetical protein